MTYQKRAFDLFLAIFLIFFLIFPMLIIALLVKLTSRGPAIHWSKRVGYMGNIFLMPKFRTMNKDAPQLATNLLKNKEVITSFGKFLRKYSLDELPQLFSILRGEMSFVGPRPALFNQYKLIKMRDEHKIHLILPGITGWAQVNGRDSISLEKKVFYDKEYIDRMRFSFDLKIILLTVLKVLNKDNISH